MASNDNDNDIDRLWAAINQLQKQVGSGGGGGRSAPPSGSDSGQAPSTPEEWIAGVISLGLPPGGPRQMMQQAGRGGQGNDQDYASSVTWCTSRFVCATMSCGGSGWC